MKNETQTRNVFLRKENMNQEEKNTYVKKQLTKALLELLNEKSIHEISVKELTEKAQVGRVSFYRNFKSKEEILKKESDRLILKWGKKFEEDPNSSPEKLFPSLFDFFKEHKKFYSTLYKAGLSQIMLDTILQTIDIPESAANVDAYMKSFWAYGIYGWMIEWIKRGMPESGKELIYLWQKMAGKQP